MALALEQLIADRIRAERERIGLSQAELARRLGWKASAVSRLERGERDLRASTIDAVARALGVSAGSLMSYEQGNRTSRKIV